MIINFELIDFLFFYFRVCVVFVSPPPNNVNSNRGQEPCKERDTPDSFVPSSSPESVVGMEISRYPDLSLVKEEPPSPCLSPVLPMLPTPNGKGTLAHLQYEHFVYWICLCMQCKCKTLTYFNSVVIY